ncbi:response regulator [Sulfurovum sp. XTW-4]|uniref:histidine kinase n=1 Tax=Sulfurovum xiamenensis TaxID=3019066 RepID=A0ABT7QSY9_9BACT|nr:response regulator [Sulfurovum xiamenensis]MDM5264125.1 response regulator [Sulfurovum xiamenensis]
MYLNKISMAIIGLSSMGYAQADQGAGSETFWLWIALFALGIVGIAILFVTSYQTQKLKQFYKSMFEKQLEMERNQNLLLANMSENVHNIAKQTLEETQQLSKTSTNKDTVLGNTESRLLDVTHDLLDFLRLKSKQVEIVNEAFNINNVLNEVSGSICSQFLGSKAELIFDIHKNVPRHLIGDSLHLGQALKSILEYLMVQEELDEVKLEVSMFDTFEENVELQFQFSDKGRGIDPKTLENLFVPYYDVDTGKYVGLGLFVANALVDMMKGKLTVESREEKGSTFTLTLPFDIVNKSDQRRYRLPEKALIEKKVFIVDSNYNSALAVKRMFTYFRHEVTVLSKKEFMKTMPNLNSFDIVILDESLFDIRLIQYLNQIKMGKELKVIALNSLLHSNQNNVNDEVIDAQLFKPLNQERVFEMIVNMYNIKVPAVEEEQKDEAKQIQTYRRDFTETKGVTQHSFQDFSGKNILIVEDNLINQKVLLNLLHLSGINISVANNGQEAVDMVKKSQFPFDLVLMDINMPIMDGFTATQMIRLESQYDGMPIVAFTALVLDSEIQKMFNCGINAFLAKPLNIGKLYTAFSTYLDDTSKVAAKKKEVESQKAISYQGININEGITHANNSEALYREILKEFATAYGTSDEIFTKLIKEHRYEQVKMLCIDMRGLTGAIGAEDMHALINDILHKILYKKYELLANYNEKYKFEIQTLNRSIQKYINAA